MIDAFFTHVASTVCAATISDRHVGAFGRENLHTPGEQQLLRIFFGDAQHLLGLVCVLSSSRRYLSDFSRVCGLLEERGVSPAILRQEIHR